MKRIGIRWLILSVLAGVAAGPEMGISAVTIWRDRPAGKAAEPPAATFGPQRYDHGDPSNLEQYFLELINRARAHPEAEVFVFFNSDDEYIDGSIDTFDVDTDTVIADFAGYTPQPPLALNAALSSAAGRHSRDMAEKDFQGHTGSDGSSLRRRLDAVGYPYVRAGENVFAYAYSMLHAQAAFLIDWGVPDLGHRKNLMNLGEYTDFREVGLGVVSENDPNTTVGPWVVTQDFGTVDVNTVFIVGVAYRDDDGDRMYDPGEGVAGVEITPDRGGRYAVTSASGGYAIPMSADSGTYVIGADSDEVPVKQVTVEIARENVKIDFVYTGTDQGALSDTIDNDETDAPPPPSDSGGCGSAFPVLILAIIVAGALLEGAQITGA